MMGIHLSDSIEANSQLHHLYCNTTVRVKTGINPQRYVDAIFPPVKSDEASSDQRRSDCVARFCVFLMGNLHTRPARRRCSKVAGARHNRSGRGVL